MKKILLFATALLLSVQMNAWKPILIGHKGSYKGVENTYEAFVNGVKYYGYTMLECDMMTTKDNRIVLCHDANLSNFGVSNCTIGSKTLAELRKVTLTQTRGGTKYTGKLMTIEEFCALCDSLNVSPVIEIKGSAGIGAGSMTNFPQVYNAIVSNNLENKAIILSDYETCTQWIHNNYPSIHVQQLWGSVWPNNLSTKIAFCKTNKCDASVDWTYVYQADTKTAWNNGVRVSTWTIDGAAAANKAAGYGCAFITTDYLKASDMTDITWPLSGNAPVWPAKTDFTNPTISNVQTSGITSRGYTITCSATDNVKVSKVDFTVWYNTSDKTTTSVTAPTSGSTYTCVAKVSEHGGNHGTYHATITAYDADGNSATATVPDVTIPNPQPGECNAYDWENKGDMYLAFQTDFNAAKSMNLNVVKREGGQVYVRTGGNWVLFATAEAAHTAPNTDDDSFAGALYSADGSAGEKLAAFISSDSKWAWLKTYILNQNSASSLSALQWRCNIPAFFLNAPAGSYNANFTTAGTYEAFQPTWDDTFCGTSTDTMYTVTINTNPAGLSALVSGAGKYKKGSNATIKAISNSNYNFLKWSDNNTNATRTITVNANVTYTAEFEAVTPGPTPTGDCNSYGWKTGEDMYQALAADVIAAKNGGMNFAFSADFIASGKFGAASAAHDVSGISVDISTFDEAFFSTSPYKEKWQWLLNYMEARCTADGKSGPISAPDSHSQLIRYNLAAFFANGQTTQWPITADYTSYGVNSTQYESTWGTKLCKGTTDIEEMSIEEKNPETYKMIMRGRIVIARDGIIYDLMGNPVK